MGSQSPWLCMLPSSLAAKPGTPLLAAHAQSLGQPCHADAPSCCVPLPVSPAVSAAATVCAGRLQNAWKFFVYIAQFEDRPFRYTCGFNYSTVATPAF